MPVPTKTVVLDDGKLTLTLRALTPGAMERTIRVFGAMPDLGKFPLYLIPRLAWPLLVEDDREKFTADQLMDMVGKKDNEALAEAVFEMIATGGPEPAPKEAAEEGKAPAANRRGRRAATRSGEANSPNSKPSAGSTSG